MIGPITEELIDEFLNELNKDEYKNKYIPIIIDPFIDYIIMRFKPYLLTTIIMLIVTIILSWFTLSIIINRRKYISFVTE